MKKFLLSLVGLFVAFAANAAHYWIHGQIIDGDWHSFELKKNESTGKYELTQTLKPGQFGIKAGEANDPDKAAWYSSPTATKDVKTAGAYKVASSGNTNFVSTLEGNYTIALSVTADGTPDEITFTPYAGTIEEGPTGYYLRGDCFGGSWTDMKMTESNGVWTWTGTVVSGTESKSLGIKKCAGDVQKAWYWAPSSRPGVISDAGKYKLVDQADDSQGKNLTTKINGEFTFTFNPETLELIVEGENQDPSEFDVNKWYFVGQRTGWNAQEAYELTKEEDGTYTLDMDITMNPAWPFKFNNGNFDDDYDFGANSESDKVSVDVPYTLGGHLSGNLFVASEIKNPHIVLNVKDGILTITSRENGGDNPPVTNENPDLFLTGSFQQYAWTAGAEKYKFSREGNVYTLQTTDLTIKNTDQFKIVDNTWNDDIDFGSNADDDKVVPGVAYTVVKHAGVEGNDHNLQLSKSLKNPKFVFNIETLSLTVTGEEVSDNIVVTADTWCQMHGNIFTGAWADGEMTKKGDEWVMENVVVKSGEFGIRIYSSATDKNPVWISSENTTNPAVVLDSDNKGSKSGENWTIIKGTYTFSFNPSTLVLKVTGTQGEDLPAVWTYNINGNIADNGSNWKNYEMTKNGEVWTVTLEDLVGGQFGIQPYDTANESNGKWISSVKGDTEGAVKVVLNQDMAAATTDNANWEIGEGSYTFAFNPEEMTLKVTKAEGGNDDPQPSDKVYDYYIHGNLSGEWKSVKMKVADGKAVLENVEVEAGQFGIKVEDPDKELDPTNQYDTKQIAWYAATKTGENQTTPVVLDESMQLVLNSEATPTQNLTVKKGKYTFTFDIAKATLRVTGAEIEDVDPVYAYALRGCTEEDGGWNDYEMTEKDGKWTVTLDNPLHTFGIKQIDTAHSNQQTGWYAADGETEANENADYAVKLNGSNWTSPKLGGLTTYTFDPEHSILTIKAEKTSGVIGLDAEEGEAIYYNLQGQRVANPDKGIFIRVVGGKAQKVMKK